MTSGVDADRLGERRRRGHAPRRCRKTNIGAIASNTLRCPESTAPRKANDASTP